MTYGAGNSTFKKWGGYVEILYDWQNIFILISGTT